MNKMIIKVCGMRDGENISQVSALGVDWIGMIFYDRSPRNVTMIPTNAGIIPDRAPDITDGTTTTASNDGAATPLLNPALTGRGRGGVYNIPLRVGVFVDEMAQNIITRAVNFRLDIIQLHGNESPTHIRNLRSTLDPDLRPGIKFMKAISVNTPEDIGLWREYADCVDYLLFDTKCDTAGGSGRQFDWQMLDAYDGDLPFLLSGGIGPKDTARVKAFHHPRCIGIDLNSRFELEPALKDVDALRTFISEIKTTD